jgi:ADP-heptose:LPS heptosyltransferase
MYPSAPILVIHQGALGDLISSLPALYSLRLHNIAVPWTMAGNLETLSLFHHRFYAQEVISIHQKEWAALYQEETPIPMPFRDFLSSFQKAFIFSAGNPDLLIRGMGRAGLKDIVRLPSFPDVEAKIPVHLRQRTILESARVTWVERDDYLFPDPEDLAAARNLLNRLFDSGSDVPFWAVHPGSGSPHKNWPWDRFLETAILLRSRGRVRPLFLIGPVEEDTESVPIKAVQDAGFPVIRKMTLPVLAALLTLCGGYLGNDSGVSHLAAALGIPTLAIFGPTDPLLWAPRGKAVKVLAPFLPCAPCSHEKMTSCPLQECLDSIPVSQVLEAVEDVT